MRISRRKIRQLILEAPDGKSGAVVTGGEDSNIDLRAMEGISNGIIPKVAKFLFDEAYLDSEDDRWAITFKMGSNSLLPIKKGKVPDIIWAGGQGSFGGKKLGDQTRDVKTLKKKLKPFLARLYAQEMGDKFRYIKWGKEIRISLRAGASIPHNTPIRGQGNQTVEAIAAATGESKSTILNIAKKGGNTVVPGRGKSRGGGGTNKCVRELQEFLVQKKVEKTKGRSYTDKDIDGQWGKNTRHAFYYYLVNTQDNIDQKVKDRAEMYLEDNDIRGWKKILELMELQENYKGLCKFVENMKEQKPKEEEESEEEKKKEEEGDLGFEEVTEKMTEAEFIAKCEQGSRGGTKTLTDLEDALISGDGIPIRYVAINSSNLDKTKGGKDIYDAVFKAAGSENSQYPEGGFDNEEIGFGGTFMTNCAYNYTDRELYLDGNTGDYNYGDIVAVSSNRSNGWFVLVHKDNPLATGKKAINPLNESSRFKNKKLLREFRKYLNLV